MQTLSKNSYAKSIQDQPLKTYSRTKYTKIYIQKSNIKSYRKTKANAPIIKIIAFAIYSDFTATLHPYIR